LPEEVGGALEDAVSEAGEDPGQVVGNVRGEGASSGLEEVFVDLAEEEFFMGGFERLDGGQDRFRIEKLFGRDADVLEGGQEEFAFEVVGGGEHSHAGFDEEGVEEAHDGGGFDEERADDGHGEFDQLGGQAEGSELGVDDDAGDGSDLAVDQVGSGGDVGEAGVAEVGGDVSQLMVQGRHGIDDDADGVIAGIDAGRAGGAIKAEGPVDRPGAARAVVEVGERPVLAEGARADDEVKGQVGSDGDVA